MSNIKESKLLKVLFLLLFVVLACAVYCWLNSSEAFACNDNPDQDSAYSSSNDYPVRKTDVETAGEGCYMVSVPGTFDSMGKEAALELINSYRKEACEAGNIPDPRDSTRCLTMDDYVPIKWSGDLEWIAQTRAVEGAVYMDHTRPNKKGCFTIEHNGVSANGENLYWVGYGSMVVGVKMWYEEKEDWVGQSGAVTGHYTAMINPNNTYVGLGSFTMDGTHQNGGAGSFYQGYKVLDEYSNPDLGKYNQLIEASGDDATLKFDGNFKTDLVRQQQIISTVDCNNSVGKLNKLTYPIASEITWTSSDDTIATIDNTGTYKGKKAGTVNMNISADCLSGSKEVTIDSSGQNVLGIDLSDQEIWLKVGQSKQLTTNIYPSTALNKEVEWSTSGYSGYVEVKDGLVTAKNITYYKHYDFTVTAKTVDGGYTAVCKGHIVAEPEPTLESALGQSGLINNKNTFTASAKYGSDSYQYQFIVNNQIMQDYSDASTFEFTPSVAGTNIVKCNVKDKITGDVSQTEYKYFSTNSFVPITSLTFENNDIKKREGYFTQEMSVCVEPENATTQQLQWESSDEDMLQVSSVSSDYRHATISGKNPGSCHITCKKDDNVFAFVNFQVFPDVGDYITSSVGQAGPVGTTTKFFAHSDSSKHYQYKFTLNGRIVQDYSDINEYSFTPSSEGKYSIMLYRDDLIDGTSKAYYYTYYSFVGNTRVTGVTLDKHSLELKPGSSQTVVATVLPGNASYKNIEWTSSNENIAKVENGVITGVGKGTAKISVNTLDGGFTDVCDVTVADSFSSSIESSSGWKMSLGTSTTFTTTCSGGSGNYIYQYYIDDIKYGKETTDNTLLFDRGLQGRHVVVCKVTDTTSQKQSSAENILVIYDSSYVPVTDFSIEKDVIYISPNKSVPFNFHVTPENASNKFINWSSGNTRVASVYKENYILGWDYGTTTLTGVTDDGSHSDTVTVICTDEFSVSLESSTGSTLPQGQKSKVSSLAVGGSGNYEYKFVVDGIVVQDFGAKNNYEFSSTSLGAHSIVCETKDVVQDTVVSCEFVINVIEKIVPVTGVTLNKNKLELGINQSSTLTANVIPEDATNKNVSWSSSDSSVATVENGNVVAKKKGKTTIKVVTEDGGFEASCQVEVFDNIGVSVSSKYGNTFFVGMENQFSASVSGGSGSFSYQFLVDDSVVQEYSDFNTYVFTPQSARLYKITCKVKDNETLITQSSDFSFTAVSKPAPQVVSTTTNSVYLQWPQISGVEKYSVATKNDDGTYKTYTSDLKTNSYTITGLNESTSYKCLVQACIKDKWNTFDDSDLVIAKTCGSRPVVIVVEEGDGYADVSWDEIPGATKYAIAEMENGSYRNYTTECKNTKYRCDNLANGYEHYILVQAYVNGEWTKFDKSNYCSVFPQGVTKPTTTVKSTTDHSVKLSWAKVAGSTEYAAAVRDNSGKYTTKFVGANTTSAEIDGLADSANYDCLVQCKIYGTWSSFTEDDFAHATTKGNRPVPREVKTGDGYADIAWDAIPGATAYAIATMENGKYKNYSITCTDTSYHCDNLANGYGHYLLVQAYVDGKWSPFSKDNYLLVNIDGPTKKPTTKVSGTTESSTTITWNMVPGASEYAVALRDVSGKYISQYFKVDSFKIYPSTATFTGLKDGTNYKAIVQSKIFGSWSSFSEAEMADVKTTSNRPTPRQTTIGDGYADIAWEAIPNATKYAIAEMENGKYRNYTTEWTGTTYHCDDLANGYGHYILVQAYVNGKWTNFDCSNYLLVAPTGPTKPLPKVASTTSKSITLSWSKVAGAKQYAAAVRLDDGSFKTVVVGKDATTATIEGLQPGKAYKCLVQCQIYGAWSSFTEADFVSGTTKASS